MAFPSPYAGAQTGRWSATPNDVVARLNQLCVVALNSPKTKTRFAALMAEPVASTPEQFGNFMNAGLARYEKGLKGWRSAGPGSIKAG